MHIYQEMPQPDYSIIGAEVARTKKHFSHLCLATSKDAVLACTHFEKDAKSILNEQITNICNTIEELRFILKKRENFWILNLCTLYQDGLNQDLNDV